jgi:simple sugar transport system permease protein
MASPTGRLSVTQALGVRLSNGRRFLPLAATIVMFGVVYAFGVLSFPAMRDSQPLFNLVNTAPFLLIAVVGQALVIISGGIDLSVGGVIALTTVATAALLENGWDPPLVIGLMLLMGISIGAVMGFFITYLKVQPFIATLAGMWFARGMCYLISDAEIRIYDPTWKTLAGIRVLIPGLADPVAKTGSYLTILGVIALVVLVAGLFVAHLTRFGRTLYAMGGDSGRNEGSARLMGLPVDRTKMQVYMVSGFCSALAGLAYSVYVGSGHGSHAMTMELTVIAAVVIGGVALTGGRGYVLGAFFGVLILALIQSLILYQGQLSSWWTSIFIGLLMLLFIGVQSVLATLDARSLARAAGGAAGRRRATWRDRRLLGGAAVVLAAVIGTFFVAPLTTAPQASGDETGVVASGACQPNESREQETADLLAGGAVIIFQKFGGSECLDQLFGIHPDGRVAGSDGTEPLDARVDPETVTALVTNLEGLGWFTDDMYTTWHHPCGECYTYSISITSGDQTKTVGAVDGGTDAPSKYWLATSRISAVLRGSETP